MSLPSFEYLEPRSVEETLEMLAGHDGQAAVVAGGTDLLVRMKQRLAQPAFLVSLKHLKDLNYIRREKTLVVMGATTPLVSLRGSELIRTHFPALAEAARLIGAPSIQHFRGTIGGNLCLQTRCLYYNQSAFWRSGRPPCHKDHGKICYAEENSDRCRSANQSDGACALMGLGARIVLSSTRGKRTLPIEDFFTGRGEAPFALGSDELVTEIQIPSPGEREGNSFQKLTYRSAIDYALVSAAAWLAVEKGRISRARLVIGGAGASPLLLKEVSDKLVGKEARDKQAVEETAKLARSHASAFMVDNLGSTLEYRKKMSAVMAKRAVEEALDQCFGNSAAAGRKG
ncbi:MAG: FAD binding domain-containing protein [Deltaproteobacteria bacterium]